LPLVCNILSGYDREMKPERQPERDDTVMAMIKAVFGVAVVVGAWFLGFGLVAGMFIEHGNIAIPLLCALCAGFATAGFAAYLIRQAFDTPNQ
jgi:predicted MFS family arabinose efflux permease